MNRKILLTLTTLFAVNGIVSYNIVSIVHTKDASSHDAIDRTITEKLKNVPAKNLKRAIDIVHKMVGLNTKKITYPVKDYIYAAEVVNESYLILGGDEINSIYNFEHSVWPHIVSTCNKSGKLEKIDLVSILSEINKDIGNEGVSKKHIDFFEFESRVITKTRCCDAHRGFNTALPHRLCGLIDDPKLRDKVFNELSLAFAKNYIDRIGKHTFECDDLETGDLSNRVRVISNFIDWVANKVASSSSQKKACETLLKEVNDYEWK